MWRGFAETAASSELLRGLRRDGRRVQGFDGRAGWAAKQPAPLVPVTAGAGGFSTLPRRLCDLADPRIRLADPELIRSGDP